MVGMSKQPSTPPADAAAQVAAERERIKAALMAMHERSKQSHNYYACAAVEIFGPLTTPASQDATP